MATSTIPANYYYRKSSGPITKKYYEDAMSNMANFNLKLASERKMRLPYLDYQTRIAQNHSQLFMSVRDKEPGVNHGQIYSYPQRLWKKCKHTTPGHQDLLKKAQEGKLTDEDLLNVNVAENPWVLGIRLQADRQSISQNNVDSPNRENSHDKWYVDDFEELEPMDAGEIDDPNTDSSDFENQYVKKKKKKNKPQQTIPKVTKTKAKRPSRVNNDSMDNEDKEKPYKCDSCGARYKTRAGLHYHLNHYHAAQQNHQRKAASSPALSQDNTDSNSIGSSARNVSQPPISQVQPPEIQRLPVSSNNSSTPPKQQPLATTSKSKNSEINKKEKAEPNDYCDFCLGDCNENKQTGEKEELVSCSDCGRAGHPTCLQFTPNMIISVKKYNWQCIECKSCGLCGTSDNDDQLLFCDDCDRGYHMYCLQPPLTEPPEGSWSCHLCIKEFHMEDKNNQ